MRASCKRNLLLEALAVTDRRQVKYPTGCPWLKAAQGALEVTATTLQQTITCVILALVEAEGEAAVPAARFGEVLEKLPADSCRAEPDIRCGSVRRTPPHPTLRLTWPGAVPFADRTLAGGAGLARPCASVPAGGSARLNSIGSAGMAAKPNGSVIAFNIAVSHWWRLPRQHCQPLHGRQLRGGQGAIYAIFGAARPKSSPGIHCGNHSRN